MFACSHLYVLSKYTKLVVFRFLRMAKIYKPERLEETIYKGP